MKKGDFSISVIFAIFVAVIASFVIIGLITKWSFNADRIMCSLSGDCEKKDSFFGIETEIKCGAGASGEFGKYIELCDAKGKEQAKSGICYAVTFSEGTCGIRKEDIVQIAKNRGVTNIDVLQVSSRTLISYKEGKVVVS